MEFSVYGEPGVALEVDSDGAELARAWLGQRERLLATFRSLDDEEWTTETRCTGWDARALAAHLGEATTFFAVTLGLSRTGQATQFLADFDPQTSTRGTAGRAMQQPAADALAALVQADEAVRTVLADYAADGDDDRWELPAEGPPGHMPARLVLQHALFDSWLHERDLVVPLGRTMRVEAAELRLVTSYLAGLASLAMLLVAGLEPEESERIVVTDPELGLTLGIDIGPPTRVQRCDASASSLQCSFVDLADAMSGRGPFPESITADDRATQVLSGALLFLSDA